jgi:hypothetical protein
VAAAVAVSVALAAEAAEVAVRAAIIKKKSDFTKSLFFYFWVMFSKKIFLENQF